MGIPRCPHGIYNGTIDGAATPYCSGCFPPDPIPIPFKGTVKFTKFPYNSDACPCCHRKKGLVYVDDTDWHCELCGACDDGKWIEE